MRTHLTSIAFDEESHEHPDCGCKLVRDDADGSVRYYQCATHAAAPDLLRLAQRVHFEINSLNATKRATDTRYAGSALCLALDALIRDNAKLLATIKAPSPYAKAEGGV